MQVHTVDIYKDSISNILRSKNKAGAKYFLALDFSSFLTSMSLQFASLKETI